MNQAAATGNLDQIIKYYEDCYDIPSESIVLAAANGHLNVVQWLYTYGKDVHLMTDEYDDCGISVMISATGDNQAAMEAAATNGHLDIVEWLWSKGVEGTLTTMKQACSNGHLEIVQWLHSHGVDVDLGCALAAVNNGHQSIVKFVIDTLGDIESLLIESIQHRYTTLVQYICCNYQINKFTAIRFAQSIHSPAVIIRTIETTVYMSKSIEIETSPVPSDAIHIISGAIMVAMIAVSVIVDRWRC